MRFRSWGRAAAGRALIALILVAAVATCGWLLVEPPHRTVQTAADVVPAEQPGGNAAIAAAPTVLEPNAPEQAQAPREQGRSELEKWAANLSGPLDIPERALIGYATGELTLRDEDPGCHLSWVTLAGIGKASSNHGRFGGASLAADGRMTKALGAVPLTGAAGEPATEPRSGPMQLTQGEWHRAVAHGDLQDIQDIDDAAVAAGRTLCAGSTDLQAGQGWWKAVAGYRDSDLFRQQALGNAQLYAQLSLDPASASAPSVRATRFALDQLGLPYVWGGNGPDAGAAGFDCSGLTKAAYDAAGIDLPRTADTQFRSVPPVTEPKMGDLVFYGNPATRIHHVGLYLGNGLMINAPTQGMAIQIATYRTRTDDYAGAGRPAR
ncbi:C40 family peptidase [Amycolatopsis granulosa]|uniref:C40 family peptidase n=1 Tax=Amycolatopsis granulosa TaxID=185684 RepID=UPI00141DB7D3|nr:C40 family peptidase [Amycolatopsis granulosa]